MIHHQETVLPTERVSAQYADYRLMPLVANVTGRGAIRHYICFDCLGLVEKTVGVEQAHNCPPEHEGVRSFELQPCRTSD